MNALMAAVTVTALVLSLCPKTATANPPRAIVSALPSNPSLYSTPDNAARAALTRITPKTLHEWGGVIVERGGHYSFTTPVTSGHESRLRYITAIPKSFRIVAMYHTHPCKPQGEYFSHVDAQNAMKLKLPSYVRSCVGQIYLLDPATFTTDDRRRLRNPHGGLFAGERVREPTPGATPYVAASQ
jgi:Domain of unknown function (DUF4329)